MNLEFKVGELTSAIKNLETHFTNHLHNHSIDRIISIVQTLVVISMFCFLKWGLR